MGGTKTKTVGGGQATGLANDWFSFLGNTLKGNGGVPNNTPGATAIPSMFGAMTPNPNQGSTGGNVNNQLGVGTGGYNQQTAVNTNANAGNPNFNMGRPNYGNAGSGGNVPLFDPTQFYRPPTNLGGAPGPMTGMPNVGGQDQGSISAVNTNDYGSFAGADMSSGVPGAAGGVPYGGMNFSPPVNSNANAAMSGAGGGAPTGRLYDPVPEGGNFMDRFINPVKQIVGNSKSNVPGIGGFGDSLSSLMNPDIGNMIASNPFLAGLMNYNPMAEMPNAPNWESFNPTNPGAISNQGVTYGNAAAGTTDLNSFMSQFGGDANKLLSSVGINPANLGNVNLNIPGLNSPSADFGYAGGSLKDFTKDPSFAAISAMADRDAMKKTADLRERFGLTGNTMSSGASLAESQLAAEMTPAKIAALQSLGREIQGLDLQQQGVNNNLRVGLTNAAVTDAGNRLGISADLAKTGASLGNNNIANLMQFLSSTQGQNLGAATSLAGQNASNTTNTNIANSQGALDASKANAGNNLNAQIQTANNTMQLNDIMAGQNTAKNNFNQNNYSIGSSNALNNKGMANQFAQFLGSQGINLQQLAQTGQMGIIAQLFNAFQQAAGIGTPQAQTVQQPSALSQALNFGLGAAGTIGGIMSGNPALALGGASGMMGSLSTPQITPLTTPRNLYPTSGIS